LLVRGLDLRLGPEHDTNPDPGASWKPYIVCSTSRSGSNLLCRGLRGTGVAGEPLEYLNPRHRRSLSERWGCGPSLTAYVAALRARRSSADGVFGTKLHWTQLESIQAEAKGLPTHEPPFTLDSEVLDSLFPGARYVHILRLDVNAQAVSLWMAHQSNVWSLADGEPDSGTEHVRYSFTGINRYRRGLVLGEMHWDRYFRVNGISPIRVVYEDLAARYSSVLRDVVDQLFPGVGEVRIGPPESRLQGGERARSFAERFARDLVRRRGQDASIEERAVRRAHLARIRLARALTRG
jgi:LPS sulfotransferase NodH